MGLLDNDPKPRFKPKQKTQRYKNESVLEQENRDAELNNMDRSEVTQDFADSKFADRQYD